MHFKEIVPEPIRKIETIEKNIFLDKIKPFEDVKGAVKKGVVEFDEIPSMMEVSLKDQISLIVKDYLKEKKFADKSLKERERILAKIKNDIEELSISDLEKEEVIMDLYFISSLYRKTDKEKNNKYNADNIACVLFQQSLATEMIKNPEKAFEDMEKYKKIAKERNNDSEKIMKGIETGVKAMVASYHYYSEKNYKVLFPSAEMDAFQKIDLIAVDYEEMSSEEREAIGDIANIKKLKEWSEIPDDLKKYIRPIQIKGHFAGNKNGNLGVSDIVREKGIKKIGPGSLVVEDKNEEENFDLFLKRLPEDSAFEIDDFFKRMRGVGFKNSEFIDFSHNDAEEKIKENF